MDNNKVEFHKPNATSDLLVAESLTLLTCTAFSNWYVVEQGGNLKIRFTLHVEYTS